MSSSYFTHLSKNQLTAVIPLVSNMVQNKLINDDDIASILDCVDKNISHVESGKDDDKCGDDNKNVTAKWHIRL
jgi:hypothetical protein